MNEKLTGYQIIDFAVTSDGTEFTVYHKEDAMIDTQQLAELAKKYVDLAVDGDDPHVSLYAQVATDAMRLIGSLNSLPDEHQEAS